MSEGTQLESNKQDSPENVSVETEQYGSKLEGTKLGEVSEFERAVLGDSVVEQPKTSPTQSSDANFMEAIESLSVDLQDGDIVKGVIRRVEKSGVTVDIGYKSDGFIPNSEFSSNPNDVPSELVSVGEEIYVSIVKLETKEGYTFLSRQKAEYEMAWTGLLEAMKSKEILSVRVVSKVQGGLVVNYKGIRGFIPASHLITDNEEGLDQFLGLNLDACVLQSDRRRRKVIFSSKLAKTTPSKDELSRVISGLEVGQILDGKVTSIKDFGVFVDIGGVEGLIHISELSWSRVSHPSDIVKVGDETRVFVLGIDRDTMRISLGLKQLEQDPWAEVASRFAVGQTVEGEVTRIMQFGAFVELAEGLEGLVHVSEISNDRVEKVEDFLSPGQKVVVKVIRLIPEEQKIGLSLKHTSDSDKPATDDQSNEPSDSDSSDDRSSDSVESVDT